VVLYLATDDIEAERDRLVAAAVEFVDEPHLIHVHDGRLGALEGTEEWMSFFRDSEDNLLALNERRPPAPG
jgi:hypothetical protein